MIVHIPFRWESVEGAVGESVELPVSARNVTVLPASEDGDRIVVSYLVDEEAVDLETEARPIQKSSVRRDETIYPAFGYATVVPDAGGETATVYGLGRTEEEVRTLY